MSGLYLMTTIANRNMLPKFLGFYQEQGVLVNLITLGRGTAASEVMDYFGLESAEKAVLLAWVTEETWLEKPEKRAPEPVSHRRAGDGHRLYGTSGQHRRKAGA